MLLSRPSIQLWKYADSAIEPLDGMHSLGNAGGLVFALVIPVDGPHSDLTKAIIGGLYETANELGPGYPERVHTRALQIVLIDKGLKTEIDVPIRVYFRGKRVGKFLADMVVNNTVLLEIKRKAALEPQDEAQILNYLHCAGGGIGLLVNFGKSVEFRRFVKGDLTNCLPRLTDDGSAPGGRRPTGAGQRGAGKQAP